MIDDSARRYFLAMQGYNRIKEEDRAVYATRVLSRLVVDPTVHPKAQQRAQRLIEFHGLRVQTPA